MTLPAKKKLTKSQQDMMVKLMGIMFESNFEGERANAAAQATRILQKVGLTLEEYLASQKQVAVAQDVQTPSQQPPANWKAMAEVCLTTYAEKLSHWEVHRLDEWIDRGSITPAQWAIVEQVHKKVTRDRPWRKGRNWDWN